MPATPKFLTCAASRNPQCNEKRAGFGLLDLHKLTRIWLSKTGGRRVEGVKGRGEEGRGKTAEGGGGSD
eukprot:2657349-Rhodomonas_salina.2